MWPQHSQAQFRLLGGTAREDGVVGTNRHEVDNQATITSIFVILLVPLVIMGIAFTTMFFDNPMGKRIRDDFGMGDISPLHGGGAVGLLAMLAFLGLFFGFSIWLWRAMTNPSGRTEDKR